ncbi:uncharacterized protein LOC134222821 [Armigeres subalbatus]|uniref:uncharacterized protein LOC134222821 n=1 Tax=Armigeres subalbatus TaxID=124917 RepID=UPI002ED57EC8
MILKIVQDAEFASEIDLLKEPKRSPWSTKLPKSSVLYKLSPFMDGDGLLRMKGRIDACKVVEEVMKHPILLPKHHTITDLIIARFHQRYCHMNHQTAANEIRRKFYMPQLIIVCPRNVRPSTRTVESFLLPVLLHWNRKTEKRWGVLITCLTIRAVHIELAYSLTTDSSYRIIAIRNFIARRGSPVEIISDRGTNFIGASRELKKALQHVNQDKLMEHFVTSDTKWSFNPPASPHFGGAWERLVQSVKKALKHTQLTRTPTDELLRNMLTEPTELPLDDEHSQSLTPNHFLLGSSDGSKPPIAYDNSSYLKHTWKLSQVYVNRFWRRWVSEYLPTLTRRSKWFSGVKPLAEGDIVVIVNETLPRNCWPRGRVVRAIQSKDGQVRRALVRTSTGLLERPAVKLAVLDVATASTSNQRLRVLVCRNLKK